MHDRSIVAACSASASKAPRIISWSSILIWRCDRAAWSAPVPESERGDGSNGPRTGHDAPHLATSRPRPRRHLAKLPKPQVGSRDLGSGIERCGGSIPLSCTEREWLGFRQPGGSHEQASCVRPRRYVDIYHGVFAPNAKLRRAVVSDERAAPPPAPQAENATAQATPPPTRYWAWAELMRRAFGIDVLECPESGGRMRVISTITDAETIGAILDHLAGRAPPSAPTATPVLH